MICDLDLVEALAFGELPRDRRVTVAAHVAACPSCSRELSMLQAERALFASASDTGPLPDVSAVLAASRSVPRPRSRRGLAFAVVAAAACLALTVGARVPAPLVPDDAAAQAPPVLACYEGEPETAESDAYNWGGSIAAVERDYEACLIAMPSSPARERIEGRRDTRVTQALFTPLPLEACE